MLTPRSMTRCVIRNSGRCRSITPLGCVFPACPGLRRLTAPRHTPDPGPPPRPEGSRTRMSQESAARKATSTDSKPASSGGAWQPVQGYGGVPAGYLEYYGIQKKADPNATEAPGEAG